MRQDVCKLEEYLRKHCREFRHLHCSQVDQQLNHGLLYKTLVRLFLYLPGVRNLKLCIKVALDFVSPENIQDCIHLTNEFRMLPSSHKADEDRLGVCILLACITLDLYFYIFFIYIYIYIYNFPLIMLCQCPICLAT
ncbi:lysine-specific demethylase JMJ25-like isoform X2 [Cajanus cajan]|uniref:lysine-specific demethylase JMJ25-like isoform X2 n=1 Tax=Cajanus cajan TaxID=3821 RepID=UPI0010FB86C2|nr:lysine-specific demethylase JMJ25-like isoform X2 [Cajanus cajan]